MTIAQSQRPEVLAPLRWTREEYYQLAEQGHFLGKRVMLIDGEIIEMPGQKEPHAWGITLLNRILVQKLDPEFVVRCQLPLDISDFSEPEPDFAILRGPLESLRGRPHPMTAELVIEVSDSTLVFDQTIKQSLYASHGIPEYWVVNLVDRRVEVYRSRREDGQTKFGWRYEKVQLFIPGDEVELGLKANCRIKVNEILP